MPELQDSVQETSEFNTTFRGNYDAAESQSLVEYALSVSEQTGGSLPAPEEQDGEDDEQDWLKSAGLSLGRDVSLGVMQAPRSIARGGIAGINSMIGFVDEAIDFLPTISILDKEGKRDFIPGVMSGSEFERRMNLKRAQEGKEALPDFPQIPIPGKPAIETVTGSGLEVISQFAVGFKGVDKLAKSGFLGKQVGDWIQGKGILPEAVKGALGELLAFDQHEERLANVLHEIPFLKGSVTEFLRAKPEDTFAEGKFKQAVEGFGLGIAGGALVKGVVLLKKGLAASGGKAAPDAAEAAAEAAAKKAAPEPGVSGEHFNFLGDVDGESLIRKEQKLEEAAAEVQAAFGKPKQIPSKPSPSIDDYEINFSRIDAPEDIKQLMDEMVNRPELKIGIDAARRGKKSHAETIAEAADIDGFESLMQRRTGEAYNAEYIVAGRKIYYDTTAKLIEAAKRAQDPNAGAVDQFNFRKMLATHHAVQKEFMGIRAEAGRALQAWRIPVGGSAPQNLRELEGILSHHGGSGASQELAQKLVAYGDHLNDAQINGIVQKGATARTVEALSEAWTLGLLTNPTTHVVNLASNVMTSFMLAGERFVMAAIPGSGVSVREGVSFFHGMMQSQKLAIKNMTTAFRTGETGFGVGKLELPRVRATSREILDPEGKAGYFSQALDGWGSVLSKYAGGALVAADEYSKTVLYQGQMYALATRQGIEQGLSGKDLSKFIGDTLQEVPEAIRHDAADFASYGTFTKELGKGGQYVQSLIALHPEMRFVAPFVRTPANIFKFSAERTPLAFLARGIRDDIAAGGVRKATALSRVAMGTSVMAIASDMALQGNISGSGPSDPKTRAQLRDTTGWKPYSIKINGEWYSYSRFEPMATLMGFSADIAEIVSNYEAYDVSEQSQVDNLVA
ncbi:MAG: hypothetical protein KAS59_00215, partial [Alphaproteobacteria bacterium]|nr:hypothetical protein [Alphaproteobacteria bacterium]